MLRSELRKAFVETVKRGGLFGNKYTNTLFVYGDRLKGEGFRLFDGVANPLISYEISYRQICSISIEDIEKEPALVIEYHRTDTIVSNVENGRIALFGLKDLEYCRSFILETQKGYLLSIEEDRKQIELLRRQNENAAKEFFDNCLNFHLNNDTPVYKFHTGKNSLIAMYIGENRSLNFLSINGYYREETCGIVPYEKIHYFEKAGNISYANDINGSYSTYGGSMTGGTFSKLAAGLGGFLFGPLGMGAGALFSYKPANKEPTKTEFSVQSQVVKIDDRSVILNYYSDIKKQYLDLELPQETYNFLQTYLPEKRYSIVEAVEKKTAIYHAKMEIETGSTLPAKQLSDKQITGEAGLEDHMLVFKQKVEKLKYMKDAGLLSDQEFEVERKKIIDMI